MAQDVRHLMAAASAAHQAGRLSECEELCRRILEAMPRNVDAKLLSGIAAAKSGQPAAAIERLSEATRWEPRAFIAWNWLSMLLRDSKQFTEATACAETAVTLRPNEPDALNNLGLCYLSQSRYADAAQAFELALAKRPNHPTYLYGLANALEPLGRAQEACEALKNAIRFAPNPEWITQLANLALGEGNLDEALSSARGALDLDPNLALPHLILSQALAELGRDEEAETHFGYALLLAKEPGEMYKIRGLRSQSMGRFEDARRDFLKSIELNPQQGFAYYGVVSSKRITQTDQPFLAELSSVLSTGRTEPSEKAYLQFALGKAYDNLGDYERAMYHYDEANRITRQIRLGNAPFNRERFSQRIDDTIRTFSKIDQPGPLTATHDLPILVVGMLRSGTTLLEQILSSHPDVGAAGEQSYWTHLQPNLVNFGLHTVDVEKALSAGSRYCGTLESISPGHRFVIDKNPANFFALGLIHLALPRARIIHMRRNPVDTCLSIYMTPIRTPPEFGCDRANIAFGYQEYLRLMAHWRTLLPSEIFLEIEYEELIQDRLRTTQKAVEFGGLEWNDACLHPELNLHSIRTPSFWQARQPVYSSSIGRGQHYKQWLGSFSDLV